MTKIITPFVNATRGLLRIVAGKMFRFALVFGIGVIILSWVLDFMMFERLVVLTFVFMVLCFEGFNSVLERVLDVISPRYNKEIGIIKDMLSGSVLIAGIGAIVVGILILVRLIQL